MAKRTPKSTLPKRVFIKVEEDNDSVYLVASDEAESLIGMGETIEIGEYELVSKVTGRGVVKFGAD